MPTPYTAGELAQGQWIAESVYGTTPATALSWMGETIMLRPLDDFKADFHILPASRSFSAYTRGPYDMGFVARYKARASAWKNFFAKYAYENTTGFSSPPGRLASFSAQFDLLQGATHAYQLFNGCKVSRAVLEGKGPGQALEFEVEAWCQYHENLGNSKTTATLQSVTVGADASRPGGALLCWSGNSQVNIAGGGLSDWYLENFKLTTQHHLTREFGIRTGADASKYPVTQALNEGDLDIIFEGTILAQNQTYNNAKRLGSIVTALTLAVDTDTITLANGYFEPNDLPEYRQAVSRETVRIRFPSLAI